MASATELRELAGRLLALSVEARSQGDLAYSELLIVRAGRHLDEAQAIEAGKPPPLPPESHPHVTQQQQQPQAKKGE
jgi:hypothetical protein